MAVCLVHLLESFQHPQAGDAPRERFLIDLRDLFDCRRESLENVIVIAAIWLTG